MKSAALIYILVLSIVSSQGSGCYKPTLRKEIRQLTEIELQRYHNAVNTISAMLDPNTGMNKFDRLTKIHTENYRQFHNTPYFLLWHRHILITYEILLKTVEPDLILPYWDWSVESTDVAGSLVLTNKYLGGNGDLNSNNCVRDGPFNQLQVGYPYRKCLQRKFDQITRISNLSNRLDIEVLLNEPSFSEFSYQIEILHGSLHSHLGGDMGEKWSTNDPIFYLHHAFLDRLLYEWQLRHPHSQFEGSKYNKQVSLFDKLPVFGTLSGYLINTFNPNLCYGYLRFPDTFKPPISTPNSLLGANNQFGGGDGSRSFKFKFKDLFRTLHLLPKVQNKTMDQAITELQKNDSNYNRSNVTDINGPSDKWLQDNGFDVTEAKKLVTKRNLFQRLVFWDVK